MEGESPRVAVLAAAALVALAGGIIGGVAVNLASDSGVCDVVDVAEQGLPSVVTIVARGAQGDESGSGAVLRAGGYLLTNDHVISSASGSGTVSITYNDGSTSAAEIVGRDPDTDLAVLKAADGAPNAPLITIGSSSAVLTGQPVVALGAPLGLSGTVTSGIVSALDREMTVPGADGQRAQLVGAIQTDASINPGNSGGPLVDCSSRMVGVNTAIATVPNARGSVGGGSVGLGFAIPVDLAVRLADELIAEGRANHPTFGFEVQVLSPSAVETTGLPPGVFVRRVVAGGPADDAGLRAGDVIVEIDGRPATSTDAVVLAVLSHSAGDAVVVTYVRDGVTKQTEVTLGEAAPS